VPTEVLFTAWIRGSHQVARVGRQIQKGMAINFAGVVTGSELCDGIMHSLVFLVLQLKSHYRKSIQEQDKIDLLICFAKVEMRPERDAILSVLGDGSALRGTGLGVKETELQPASTNHC
jgi:hypothetical protein